MDTNYANQTQTDRIDEQALEIARDIIAGKRDEAEGRWAIAILVMHADVPRHVTRRFREMNPQVREDVMDKLQRLIQDKITQTEPAYLNLDSIVTKGYSLCGWARQLARAAVGSAVRDVTAIFRNTTFVDPNVDVNGELDFGLAGTGHALDYAQTPSPLTADRTSDVVDHELLTAQIEDDYTEAARKTLATGRMKLAAQALRDAFKLPAAIRPDDLIDREAVLDMLNADEDAARNAAASLHALIDGVQSPDQAAIDERLLALWDDYTLDQLHELVTKPARVAQTIAIAALTLDAKPNREIIRATLATIRRLVPNTQKWSTITRDLLDSYLASETEATNVFNRSSAPSEADLTKRMIDAMAYRERLELVAADADAHLGDTAAKVAETVATIIRSIAAGAPVEAPAVAHQDA